MIRRAVSCRHNNWQQRRRHRRRRCRQAHRMGENPKQGVPSIRRIHRLSVAAGKMEGSCRGAPAAAHAPEKTLHQ